MIEEKRTLSHRPTSWTRRIPLALAAMALLMISCADNQAVRLRYQAEKAYFEAEKAFNASRIKPELTSEEQFAGLRQKYAAVLNSCYSALDSVEVNSHPTEVAELSELTYRAATRLSQFLFAANRYDSTISILSALLSRVRISRDNEMNCYYNLGRALQSAGKFDSALTIYAETVERFQPPLTSDGEIFLPVFNLPIHLHELFLRSRDTARAEQQFKHTAAYYQSLLENNTNPELIFSAHANLAKFYDSYGNWQGAIDELLQLHDSTGQTSVLAMIQIADVYAARMNDYAQALSLYDSIATRLVGSDTLLRPVLLHKRGLSLMGQGEYTKARRSLVELDREFPGYYAQTPSAQQAKARTFDLEGNWDRAESEYRFLVEQYPGSNEAMSAYLFLAQKYAERSMPRQSEQWYQRALDNYDMVANSRSGTPGEAMALFYKAEVYRLTERWQPAAETLLGLFDKFPHTEPGRRAIAGAAVIYRHKLSQPEVADSLLETLKRSLSEVDESPKM